MELRLTIPEKQSEITLSQYQTYLKVSTDENNQNTFFLNQKIIEIFCHVPLKFVFKMKKSDVDSIASKIVKLLNDENRGEFEPVFTINGVRLGFMPNFKEMTAGEFTDLSNYISDVQTWHKAMAVMFRPVDLYRKGKYTITEYDGTDNLSNAMKSIQLDKVLVAVFFLQTSLKILTARLRIYLRGELENNPILSGISTTDTDGILSSLQLAEEIFSGSMKQPN